MIKGLTKMLTLKLIQERENPPRHRNLTMHRPITLNEFVPIQFREHNLVVTTSYHIGGNEEVENEERVDKTAFEASHSYTKKIDFFDEHFLLKAIPHNQPLFVVGYALEQKINQILIDDGSAVNILSLKIMKELEIPLDEFMQSRLMIQGFNQGGQRALGKVRL